LHISGQPLEVHARLDITSHLFLFIYFLYYTILMIPAVLDSLLLEMFQSERKRSDAYLGT